VGTTRRTEERKPAEEMGVGWVRAAGGGEVVYTAGVALCSGGRRWPSGRGRGGGRAGQGVFLRKCFIENERNGTRRAYLISTHCAALFTLLLACVLCLVSITWLCVCYTVARKVYDKFSLPVTELLGRGMERGRP
jgi:hypothetical protein